MWNQMKKWFSHLKEGEIPKEEGDQATYQNQNSNQSFQTKMLYQYPKQGAFRFPLIPDEKSEEKLAKKVREEQTRIYSENRKKTRPYQQQDRPKKRDSSYPSPFTPSDVPSPVYGYGVRKNYKLEMEDVDIPAYIRKEEKDPTFSEGHEQQQEWNQKANEEVSASITTEANDPLVKEDSLQDRVDTLETREENNSDEENSLIEAIELEDELEQQDENERDFGEAEEKKENSALEETNEKENSNHTPTKDRKSRMPFNVIMTPRDKRNHNIRKTDKDQEKQNNSNQNYQRPPFHLLNDAPDRDHQDDAWVEQQMKLLETTLQHFHVKAKVVNAMKGPTVTRFEVQPEPGVKVSKITNLSDDIKLNMAAKDIRMEAPIPGKNTIGIEVPNPKSQAVGLQEILESNSFKQNPSPMAVALGLDIGGTPVVTDLRKMPHGLIAGVTGSGKSVCINTILLSLIYQADHEDVKFLLIDPKMVELAPYNSLPHLVAPVITNVKAATSALKWAVGEMEGRYEKFVEEGVRDIDRYNEKMMKKGQSSKKMPYMVIVIDELADLMMASPQDVEDAICRIAQKARACGMHLLLATQRPSVDVITGLIKANIPTRIAFSVSSQVDSRTILDSNGAEKLLGKGDMLFLENGAGKTQRIQGAFVSDDEIERITSFVKKLAPPNYIFEQEELIQQTTDEEADELFDDAVDFVIDHNGASSSLLQRRFKIGYNRAARLIDQMEEQGLISESKGSKPRDVFVTRVDIENKVSE